MLLPESSTSEFKVFVRRSCGEVRGYFSNCTKSLLEIRNLTFVVNYIPHFVYWKSELTETVPELGLSLIQLLFYDFSSVSPNIIYEGVWLLKAVFRTFI